MRIVTFFILFIQLYCFGQDTLFYNRLTAKRVGESIERPYKSRVTGAMDTVYLKHGKWLSFDSTGNILLEVNYKANKRKEIVRKNGLEIFYEPKTGDTLLIRNYKNGYVMEQLAMKSAILKVENTIYHIYKDFGSYTVAEYRYSYSGSVDFTTIWKSSLEDPNDILRDTNYLKLEERTGDPTLIQAASFSTKAEYNHVTNPEFEKHPQAYFSIMSFTNHISDWSAASISPDLYLSRSGALSGNSFVGIRVFSLRKDIEYIQNKLRQPLKKDSIYCFSTYLKLSAGSRYATNAFGFLLSQEKQNINTDQLLKIKPSKILNTQILNYKTKWMKVQCTYKAKGGEQYLTLGSFQNHKELQLIEVPGESPESYYYVDDVSLVPISKEEDCACNFSDNRKEAITMVDTPIYDSPYKKLTIGEKLILDNIHFDNDKSQLLAESFTTLYEVLVFLQKNKNVQVEISGHTSSLGGYTRNQVLSQRRAGAVKKFLTNNGIKEDRIQIEGYGPDFLIASDDTEEGQKENRRVEFKILKL
ncbi:MAG: hypothetical protein COA58_10135 [Bacteroidetes bacterium]|nr:MAG: hypothetical protein COA58_10135 [Bacteroidota bacterium]